MARTLDELMSQQPPERHAKIVARTAALIAVVKSPKVIRQRARRSQEPMNESLGINQSLFHTIVK